MTKNGLRRVMAPQNHQFGLQKRIQRTAAGGNAVSIRRRGRRIAHTHRMVAFEIAAGQIQQATRHFIAGKGAAGNGGANMNIARSRAIFFSNRF